MTAPDPGPRRHGSLRGQLLGWLLLPLLVLWIASAVSAYQSVRAAAARAHDRTLLASARAIAERTELRGGRVAVDVPWVALDTFALDTPGRIYYQVSGLEGEFVSGYDDFPPVPDGARRSALYPALVYFRDDRYRGEPLRVAALRQPVLDGADSGMALIQVGETLEARRALTEDLLLGMLWRQGLLVLAGGALILVAVSLALRPLRRLRRAVLARPPGDPTPLDESQVQREIRPLVQALNAYTARLHALHAGQRRFIADASHQIRTPLAVLRTQAQHALSLDDPALWRESLEAIGRSTEQTVRVANQLLSLARAESGAAAPGATGPRPVLDLEALLRDLCLDRAPAAVARGIDLALDLPGGPWTVRGDATLIHEALANVLDNALRYTPAGGHVTVAVRGTPGGAAGVEVCVTDDGPGIPPAWRERVFERFVRLPGSAAGGSGLGLGIVRDVVRLHGGEVRLEDGPLGRGLVVRLRLPGA